jgi:hypothetical protein
MYNTLTEVQGWLSPFLPNLPVIVDEIGSDALSFLGEYVPVDDVIEVAAWLEVQYPPVSYGFWGLISDVTNGPDLLLNISDHSLGKCGVRPLDTTLQYQYPLTTANGGYGTAAMAWLQNAPES